MLLPVRYLGILFLLFFAGCQGGDAGTGDSRVESPHNNLLSLEVRGDGTGGTGVVVSSLGGINCTNAPGTSSISIDCSEPFYKGSEVGLQAIPDPGSVFGEWSGDCSGTTAEIFLTLLLGESKSCIALFHPTFKLTVEIEQTLTPSGSSRGSGRVTSGSDGIDMDCGTICTPTDSTSAFFSTASHPILTAIPHNDSYFDYWKGDCLGAALSATVVPSGTADKSCVAVFGRLFALSIFKPGAGNGTVKSNEAPLPSINCVPGITTDCFEQYKSDVAARVINLSAMPDVSSFFDHWEGDCAFDATTQSLNVIVDKDVTCSAIFKPLFTLTINKTGEGGEQGTVKASTPNPSIDTTDTPPGVDCGTDCVGKYRVDTPVTLAETHSATTAFFITWGGDCAGTGTTTVVTMERDKTCTAQFDRRLTLTVQLPGTGNGKVTSGTVGISDPSGGPSGISCKSNPLSVSDEDCVEIYNRLSTQVILSAVSDPGHIFTKWDGDCTEESLGALTATVSMDNDKTCQAIFSPLLLLTVQKAGNGNGTVTADRTPRFGSPISGCTPTPTDSPCVTYYASTDQVTLTATPDVDSYVKGWSGDGGCGGDKVSTIATISGPTICTVTFEPLFTLSVTTSGVGKGTVTSDVEGESGKISCGTVCAQRYESESVVNLLAQPDDNSYFRTWTGDCASTGSVTTAPVTVEGNKSCDAEFGARFTLTVTLANQGRARTEKVTSIPTGITCFIGATESDPSGTCSALFKDTDTLTLTVDKTETDKLPDPDSEFAGWEGDCTTDPSDPNKSSVSMADGDKDCTAKYNQLFTLNVTKKGSGIQYGIVTADKLGIDDSQLNCDSVNPSCKIVYRFNYPSSPTTFPVVLTGEVIDIPPSTFVGWNGDCTGLAVTASLDMMSGTASSTKNCVATINLNATVLAAGSSHTCARTNDAGMACWGKNDKGQMGIGSTSTTGKVTLVKVLFPTSADTVLDALDGRGTIAGGGAHTCAILVTGSVKCWGSNDKGQLGDGTTSDKSSPPVLAVGLPSGVTATAITAGGSHTCALLSDKTVQCWGLNDKGQLGNASATNTNSSVPVMVSGVTTATAITSGGNHTCVLLSGGTVQCWGLNDKGQLGDGTTTNSTIPVTVVTDATAIAAGQSHTCAVISGGVWCWGLNDQGQLGDGTLVLKSTPVTVTGLTGVQSLGAGSKHTCAVLLTGGVKCWGWNDFGQLGDTTFTSHTSPVTVSAVGGGGVSLTGVRAFSAGDQHSCGLTETRGVTCWGADGNGQLGDGPLPTETNGIPGNRLTPVATKFLYTGGGPQQ